MASDLEKKMQLTDGSSPTANIISPCNCNSMFLFPVTGKECYNIMMKLTNSKTSTDQISMKVMKKLAHNLSIPICKLINISFKKGVFPDVLKIACITPISKMIIPIVFDFYSFEGSKTHFTGEANVYIYIIYIYIYICIYWVLLAAFDTINSSNQRIICSCMIFQPSWFILHFIFSINSIVFYDIFYNDVTASRDVKWRHVFVHRSWWILYSICKIKF